ncbi:MAG TPA: multiheme c-type cytochrome [Blastocatellia bacterium]|nr:multiheme c-type cytochrome [Blastocatellia bacterium]
MPRKVIQLFAVALFLVGLLALTQSAWAQGNPTPAQIRPNYNYSESYSCTRCHFSRGAGGDHMPEAVGVWYDDTAKVWNFSGEGWLAAKHSQSNYKSTQNTYCAKCHSPLQATPQASFKNGIFKRTDPIADGQMEGVTCAACHPSHNAAVVLGRRLGIYKYGMNKATPEAYDVIHEGEEDQLCLNCHVERHNEDNPAFHLMYEVGVRCVDCHMAVYGQILGTHVDKRFHDFKVAKNVPYSCGADGSIVQCHPGFSAEGTLAFIPYLKEQHMSWWPMKPGKKGTNLVTAADYLALWREIDARTVKGDQ